VKPSVIVGSAVLRIEARQFHEHVVVHEHAVPILRRCGSVVRQRAARS